MASDTWSGLVAAHERARRQFTGRPLEHAPLAAVLACSDARVPPSVIFDQPAGSLFVVRIAGNTASPVVLASLDYAVSRLGVDLVVVLGHSECGAVQAAAAGTGDAHLDPVVLPIREISRAHPSVAPARLVELNVERTVQDLLHHDGPTGLASRCGSLEVRGAVHDLRTATLVDLHPSPIKPKTPLETAATT